MKQKLPIILLCSILYFCLSAIDSDSRYMSTEEQNRELTRSIRREVAKLSEQWNNLIDKSDNWKQRLDDFMTVSGKWYNYCYRSSLHCLVMVEVTSLIKFFQRYRHHHHYYQNIQHCSASLGQDCYNMVGPSSFLSSSFLSSRFMTALSCCTENDFILSFVLNVLLIIVE